MNPNTKLGGIVGAVEVKANSFHHQAVKKLGDGFAAVAHSADGVVEGIENPSKKFAVGVGVAPGNI
ncbi:MAG: gamma-glutamyl-gamma-aminobutyrate hydrolase family protein [Dermatophilaceae bacterium]